MENNEKAYYEKVDIDNELKLRKQLVHNEKVQK